MTRFRKDIAGLYLEGKHYKEAVVTVCIMEVSGILKNSP